MDCLLTTHCLAAIQCELPNVQLCHWGMHRLLWNRCTAGKASRYLGRLGVEIVQYNQWIKSDRACQSLRPVLDLLKMHLWLQWKSIDFIYYYVSGECEHV